MKHRTKNFLKYLLFLGVAVALTWLAFSKTDPAKLWQDILRADYAWVFLSMLIGYSAIVSRGYRWLIMLEPLGYKPKAWNSVHSIGVLYLVNMAVPRAGELARCTSLNQVEDIPVDKLFGTVILERVIDMLMLLGIISFTFILYVKELMAFFELATGQANGAGNASSNLKIYATIALAIVTILFFLLRKKVLNHPKFSAVRNFLRGMGEGLNTIRTMRRKRAFILHTLYIWLCYYLMIYVVFFALPTTHALGWGDAFFIMVAASLGVVVPVPGGIGAYHYLVMLALGILGLQHTDGLAFATIVHSSQTLMLLMAGAFGFLFLYLERTKKRKHVQSKA